MGVPLVADFSVLDDRERHEFRLGGVCRADDSADLLLASLVAVSVVADDHQPFGRDMYRPQLRTTGSIIGFL